MPSALDLFSPPVRDWFTRTFGAPSPAQEMAWPVIAGGKHALVLAPTGSGKTLAAFLWAIQSVMERSRAEDCAGTENGRPTGVQVLYVSPLKALNNDIERNLRVPLDGIAGAGHIRVAVRTGDTPASQRRDMARRPPDILITTPESLYILLTGPQREQLFTGLRFVIVDEIHSLAGNKRGVHLSLSLERLADLVGEFQRIGLSATMRPAEEAAKFLGGMAAGSEPGNEPSFRPVEIVDAGRRRNLDVKVISAAEDYTNIQEGSIWKRIIPELLGLIHGHRTTLVFVQNRGQCERVAAWLNESWLNKNALNEGSPGEGVGEKIAEAYHGSMARAARLQMEARLKSGELRCLVATSALELGIDIGSIELVVQLQSPKSVTRALQRIGRSGHLVSATSKGRFFPTFRDDLAECAVIAELLDTGFLEPVRIPQNAVDVLAQQIVACASVEAMDLDRLYGMVRRSYCYRELPRPLFDRVVAMLSGRMLAGSAAGPDARELRPAVSLDTVNHRVAGLSHSRRLAILNAGAIPDRGLYPAYVAGKKTKVGELDEEFIFETRVGTAFLLGSSVYRLAEVTLHHVIVEPAPGALLPKLPFWHGEGIGRSFELSAEIGRFRREIELDAPRLLETLESEYRLDRRSAWNLREYYLEQREQGGPLPTDRRLVIETFPDELGNWRMTIHSVFGGRVNGLLELLAVRLVKEACGFQPESMHTDDGIMLVFPGGERPPANPFHNIDAAKAAELAKAEVLGSALFATRFRHCAQRALLLSRPLPHKRAPLHLSRIRSANLLALAGSIPEFPIIAEAARECLEDALDYAGFLKVLDGIESGEIEIAEIELAAPSPFAAAFQFSFVAAFMYDYDAPAAERAAQLLAVNREVLAQMLTPAEMGRLIRPDAVKLVEEELQFRTPLRRARSPEDLLEILVRVGDLSPRELVLVCHAPGLVGPLAADGRAVEIDIAGEPRWIAAEDRTHYLHGVDSFAIRRYAETHGPFLVESLARRYGLSAEDAERMLAGSGLELVDADGRRCARDILRRIHRVSLGILRREIEPRPLDAYTRFALGWQHVGAPAPVLDVLEQLEGFPLPAAEWREILGPRVKDLREIEELVRSGSIVVAGVRPGWLTFFARGRGALFLPAPAEMPMSRGATRLLDYLGEQGPSLMADMRRDTELTLAALNAALAELFWAGRISCDGLREIERLGRPTRASREAEPLRPMLLDPMERPSRAEAVARFRQAFRRLPGWEGRWFPLRIRRVAGEARRAELARIALHRYGVLSREWLKQEESAAIWSELLPELERSEWRGELRRGHFLDALAGMQFALPGAVDQLRGALSNPAGSSAGSTIATGAGAGYVLLNTCDPASPYEGPLAHEGWQDLTPIRRRPGNQVLLADGVPVLYAENHGARWWVRPGDHGAVSAYLGQRQGDPVTVEQINGAPAADSEFAPLLLKAGFTRLGAGGALRQGVDRLFAAKE